MDRYKFAVPFVPGGTKRQLDACADGDAAVQLSGDSTSAVQLRQGCEGRALLAPLSSFLADGFNSVRNRHHETY